MAVCAGSLAALLGVEDANALRISIGFDLGTSGARAVAVGDDDKRPLSSSSLQWSSSSGGKDPSEWTEAIRTLLREFPSEILADTERLCVSGTSASCLLAVPDGDRLSVTRGPAMYNYNTLSESLSLIHI